MNYFRISIYLFLLLLSIIFSNALNATNPVLTAKTSINDLSIPILCYHRVNPKIASIYDLTPEMLEKQFQFFKEHGYHPITASQYLQFRSTPQSFPEKPIVITFDDGNKDHFAYVFPLLKKYGFKATFFIYTYAVAEKSEYLITWTQLSEMIQAGMDIESHTFSHPYLTRTPTRPDDPRYLKWLDHELIDSKELLEKKLHIQVNLLAYPYGWNNCITEAKAVQANYQGIFTVNWGTNFPNDDILRLKRRVVSNNLTLLELEQYLISRPLSLQIISPRDGSIVSEISEIKFKLIYPHLSNVDIVMGKYKGILTPDRKGIFTFSKFKTLKSGYHMIIISGYDELGTLYINSWGFDLQQPAKVPKI